MDRSYSLVFDSPGNNEKDSATDLELAKRICLLEKSVKIETTPRTTLHISNSPDVAARYRSMTEITPYSGEITLLALKEGSKMFDARILQTSSKATTIITCTSEGDNGYIIHHHSKK